MARYIDAELFDKKLAMEVYLADDEDFTKAFVRGMELVKKAENKTPTADVVEVIRCKDCKHFDKNKGHRDTKFSFYFCAKDKFHYNITTENDFCSYGERMDGKEAERE